MPDPKKPSKPSSRGSSSGAGRARRSTPKAPESEYLASREEADDVEFEDESDEARPVAVGGSSGLAARLASLGDEETSGDEQDAASTFDDDLFALGAPQPTDAAVPQPVDGPPEIERPKDELIAAGICLLLAASTFLPWFKYAAGTKSGFAAGQLGPLVTFLALGGFAILLLRRLGKAIAFPVDHALVLEGIGWVSTIAILVSNLKPPKIGVLPTQRQGILFLSLLLAVGLALFAGRISAGAPFVVRPGWFASSAGKLGAAVLIVALGAGAAFGFVNGGPDKSTFAQPQTPQQVKGIPPCIKAHKFPIPAGVTGQFGYPEIQGNCVASLGTKLTLKTAYSRTIAALKRAKWKYKAAPAQSGAAARSIILEGPRCGGVTIAGDAKGKVTTFYVALRSCTPASPGTN